MMNGRTHLKAGIAASILLITLVFLVGFAYSSADNKDYSYTHTKAICSGNSCQDFLIVCSDRGLIEMTPLTGLVTFSDGWKDPRSEEEKELC